MGTFSRGGSVFYQLECYLLSRETDYSIVLSRNSCGATFYFYKKARARPNREIGLSGGDTRCIFPRAGMENRRAMLRGILAIRYSLEDTNERRCNGQRVQ